MNDFELGWVCGLLEGEGSFVHKRQKRGSQTRVSILMTDLDTIERFANLVGVTAKIWTVFPKGDNRKPLYGAVLCGHAAIRLMKIVLPYMGQRRTNKINSIIADWTQLPHRREPKQPPTCHPERKHLQLGLCRECYNKSRRQLKRVRYQPWIALNMTRSMWYHRGLHKAEINHAT